MKIWYRKWHWVIYIVGDSNNGNNFLHELLLTYPQVLQFRKAFENNSSSNIKLSKTQLHKTGQWREFLGGILEPLLKTELCLIGNVLKPLAISVLIHLGLTSRASVTDPAIHKKMFGSEKLPSDLASRTT